MQNPFVNSVYNTKCTILITLYQGRAHFFRKTPQGYPWFSFYRINLLLMQKVIHIFLKAQNGNRYFIALFETADGVPQHIPRQPKQQTTVQGLPEQGAQAAKGAYSLR